MQAGQDPSGLPAYALTPRAIQDFRHIIRLSPTRLRLAPGASAGVTATVVGRPRGPAVYGVVALTARQAGRFRSRRGSTVIPSVRLATNLLLRFPGKARPAGEVTGVRVADAGRAGVQFLARFAGTGDVHVASHGKLVVSEPGGRVIASRSLPNVNVLPGFVRDVPVLVPSHLAAGSYVARVEAKVAGRPSGAETPFALTATGTLPQARLHISSMSPLRPGAGSSFKLSIPVSNRGTADVAPTASIRLVADGDGRLVARRTLDVGVLKPGAGRTVEAEMPGVPRGQYHADLRLERQGFELAKATVAVLPETRPGTTARFRDWASRHATAVIAALLLVLGGGIAAGIGYVLRLRRRLMASDRSHKAR